MRPNLYLFPIILKLVRAESASGEVFLHCYCPARNLITVTSTIFTAMPSLGKKFRNIRIDLVIIKGRNRAYKQFPLCGVLSLTNLWLYTQGVSILHRTFGGCALFTNLKQYILKSPLRGAKTEENAFYSFKWPDQIPHIF